jgi:hypothetical protein
LSWPISTWVILLQQSPVGAEKTMKIFSKFSGFQSDSLLGLRSKDRNKFPILTFRVPSKAFIRPVAMVATISGLERLSSQSPCRCRKETGDRRYVTMRGSPPEPQGRVGVLAQTTDPRVYSSVTNSVAAEPEGSSPCSQEPATSPYLEPGESTSHPRSHSA